jgi:DNA-nicking Smr family endonuclease
MTGSGKDRPPKRGARPLLTPEDTSLWQRIAATIDPRRQGKPRVQDVEAAPPSSPTTRAKVPSPAATRVHPSKPGRRQDVAVVDMRHPKGPPPRASATRPSLAPIAVPAVDPRKARRIASGTIEIEARLDLHGLTQTIAHGRLVAFLHSAAAQGLRTVLVITGKGASRQPTTLGGGWREDEEVGVLRRSVPRWLAEAPLRALVIGCQVAAPRHGGEGALYVLLRRGRHSD